jgi:hypothetical protein
MFLVLESLQSEGCGFTASVEVDYTSPYTAPQLIEPTRTRVGARDGNLTVKYALQLTDIIDDGYSTSAVFTTVLPKTDGILRRQFARNTGFGVFVDAVPSTQHFTLEVGPSSTFFPQEFNLLGKLLEVELGEGTIVDPVQPFKITVFVCAVLSPVLLSVVILVRFIIPRLRKRRELANQPPPPTDAHAPMLGDDDGSGR